ncbi:MAG TPA: sigma-70 family RNA polymerase sigma factor [Opitutaceae bacterium]|nr:sigma-70 family RNA polymerase sigma factor [Opitutaceae bacterium]
MMDQIDDAELLRRYAEDHSEEAFIELVRRHLALVYRSALRQANGDTHRAEDVAQAVFTQLARKARSLARHPRLAGWLYTTTHFTTSVILRSERRRQMREREAHFMQNISCESSPSDGWDRVSPVLDEVMRELGRADREAILLHFLEGRTFADVGARLSLREDAVRMRVSRALEKLRAALARRGVTSTTAALTVMLANESAIAAPASLMASAAGIASAFAGSSAAPAVSLLQLMNTSKLAIGIAATVGILSVGSGVYYVVSEKREIAQTRAAILADDNDLLRMQSRLAEATDQSVNAEKDYARLENIAAGLRESARNAAGKGPSPVSPGKTGPDFKTLAKNPAFEAAYISNFRASLRPMFAAFYQQQGLTPAQVQRFEDVLTDFKRANFDVAASAADQGMTPNDPALKDLYRANLADAVAGLKGIATAQQVTDYAKNYQKTKPGRDVASQLATPLAYTDNPLTPQQSALMIQLISTHADSTTGVIDWSSVMAQAPGVLSSAQISMLSAVQAKIQYKQAYSQATSNGNNAGSP